MGLPRTVTRITRNGAVTFTSNVNRAECTLQELTRAALRDIGRVLRYKMIAKVNAKAGGGLRGTKLAHKFYQYWNRKRETDLVIGIKFGKKGKKTTWFGAQQELGTDGQPRRDILRATVFENIALIRQIQAQYLVHIENELNAQRLIDENAEVAGDDQDS
jgi:hypothetical protein